LSRARGRLLGTIRVDGEEFEGAALDRGWPGVEGEDVFLIEGGGRLDPAIGGEIGEEALEAGAAKLAAIPAGASPADRGVQLLS
jgi:hypothetical protein